MAAVLDAQNFGAQLKRLSNISETMPDVRDAKRRKVATGSDDIDLKEYNDGNIVKIKVKNFVTYSKTSFHLSPTLNMIIGPNGTGKSTFVCAICLGLGGKPELLGRQKYAADFIKEGKDHCIIETVLKWSRDDKKTVTIKREMTRSSKNKSKEKSEWYIDGSKKDEKSIKKLLEHLNIQLNNLCCFLPQDKVSSFAALKPEALLLETERAAGFGELLELHEKLIELDDSRQEIEKELQRLDVNLKGLVSSRDRLKEEADKYLRFKEKKDELMYHEKLLPYAIVQDRKKKAAAFKERRDNLQQRYQTFCRNSNPLDVQINEIQEQIEDKEEQIRHIKDSVKSIKREMEQLTYTKLEIDKQIEAAETEKRKLENRSLRKHQELMDLLEDIRKHKEELEKTELPDDGEIHEYAEKRAAVRQSRNELNPQLRELKDSERSITERLNRTRQQITNLSRRIESNDRIGILDTNRNRQYAETKEAVLRLRNTPELKGRVFEPPILSVSVTDPRYAKYLEFFMDQNTRLAFTAKSKEDYEYAVNNYFSDLNVAFRYPGKRDSERKFNQEEVQKKFGFDGYLVDFVQGPRAVVKMLYENIMHDIPVSLNDLTPQQLQKITAPSPTHGKAYFTKFAGADLVYNLSKSDYGSKQSILSTSMIRQGKNRIFDTLNVNEGAVKDLKEYKQQYEEQKAELEPIKDQIVEISAQIDKFNADYDLYNSSHSRLNQLKSKYMTLKSRIQRKEDSVLTLRSEAERDVSGNVAKIEKKLTTLIEKRLQAINDLIDPVVEINKISYQIAQLEFEKFELINQKAAIEKLTSKLDSFKERFKQEVLEASRKYNEVKRSDEIRRLKEVTSQYSDQLREKLGELAARYQAEQTLTEMDLRARIERIKSEIRSVDDASSSSIEKLETIESHITELNQTLPELEGQLKDKMSQMNSIKGPWEEKLDALVSAISYNFSKKFVAVASAGEVRLNKNGGLKDWRLELLVKFRDESDLRVLDPFIQSGGERAVSTIFFMLSLQGLTNSPFRVVDEINQGMDPKNESIVHKYMVESACQSDENGAFSQYFLITPKLLTNLFYHEKMAVHCIMANHRIPDEVWD